MSARGSAETAASISFVSTSSRRGSGELPIGPEHVSREMLRDVSRLARRRPIRIDDQQLLDLLLSRELCPQDPAGDVLADEADEDALGTERGDVARDVARTADVHLAPPDRKHGCGSLGRHAGHLAIDEFIEHQVANAQDGLTGDGDRERIKVEHVKPCILLAVSDRRTKQRDEIMTRLRHAGVSVHSNELRGRFN